MKKIYFIISSLMIAGFCFGQIDTTCIKLGAVKELPMRSAEVCKCGDLKDKLNSFISISSLNDSVFSISDGQVLEADYFPADVDTVKNFLVLVVSGKNKFFYVGIINSLIKSGDTLRKGDLIGLAKKSIRTNTYVV